MTLKMNICKKLTLAFAAMLAILLAFGWVARTTVASLGEALDDSVKRTAIRTDLIGAMRARIQEMVASVRGAELCYLQGDAAGAEGYRKKYDAASARVKEQFVELRPAVATDSVRQNLAAIERTLGTLDSLAGQYMSAGSRGEHADAQRLMSERISPVVQEMETLAASITKENRVHLGALSADSAARMSSARVWSLALIAISFLVGGAVLMVIRGVSGTLREISGELMLGATQTNDAATQVASASQSLAQGSSEQASYLEETSASTEEIRAMALQNADHSRAAAQLGGDAKGRFGEANTALDETVAAMNEIDTQSRNVSKVLKVIDEIAFQTNILALNAAVEAARAGQAGMGFAVVADEVRTLAQRCAGASRETAAMLEETLRRSKEGQEKVDRVAGSVHAITADTEKVRTLVDEVNEGSQQQALAIDQIAKAIVQMEQVTQSAAANAEQSAAAAEELSAQSEAMKALVYRLSAMVGSAA